MFGLFNPFPVSKSLNYSTLSACPYCKRALEFDDPVYRNHDDLLNDVHLCKICGLVYKPFLNVNNKVNTDSHYSKTSWESEKDTHLLRMKKVVEMTNQRFPIDGELPILDVGAGMGFLYDAINETGPLKKYVALEPVTEIALDLKKRHPEIGVLNSAIDRVTLPGRLFDLVFVLGVDYLFEDICHAYEKIRACLKLGGRLVVQRNVFIDQTAYVGKKIENLEDMFGSNLVMRNWFHSNQYQEFLSHYFLIDDVVREEFRFIDRHRKPFSMFQYTYFCRVLENESVFDQRVITNYFGTNRKIIDDLRSGSV